MFREIPKYSKFSRFVATPVKYGKETKNKHSKTTKNWLQVQTV